MGIVRLSRQDSLSGKGTLIAIPSDLQLRGVSCREMQDLLSSKLLLAIKAAESTVKRRIVVVFGAIIGGDLRCSMKSEQRSRFQPGKVAPLWPEVPGDRCRSSPGMPG